MFRSAKVSRVLQNLGGIGNLTAIPAGASVDRCDGVRYRAGEHGDRWLHDAAVWPGASIEVVRWLGEDG